MTGYDKVRKGYKWEVLALLWVAYLLNQADRQVFNVVLPLIREDLGLSDVAVGTIATVFNLFYAMLVPIGGFIGDRFSRKWIVTASVLFWSIATMFTGLCNGFLMLVVMRSIATGGGEAFFGPANYSLIADYHDRTRAFAMSIHQTAYYVGIILSGYAAGVVGELWGWRNAFYIFGAIGVLHGIIMAGHLRDRKHPATEPTERGGGGERAETPFRRRIPHRFHDSDGTHSDAQFLRTDLRADGVSDLDAHLSLRTFRHGSGRRRFPLDVLHASVRLRRNPDRRTHLRPDRRETPCEPNGHAGHRPAGRRAVHRDDGTLFDAVDHLSRLRRIRLRPGHSSTPTPTRFFTTSFPNATTPRRPA